MAAALGTRNEKEDIFKELGYKRRYTIRKKVSGSLVDFLQIRSKYCLKAKGVNKEKEVDYLKKKKMEELMNQGHLAGKRGWESVTEEFALDKMYEKRH